VTSPRFNRRLSIKSRGGHLETDSLQRIIPTPLHIAVNSTHDSV